MKHHALLLAAAALVAAAFPLHAQLIIPSDGSDGVFSPTQNVEVDLSLAPSGVWSDPSTGPNVGKGVYDPEKWAVVFKYASVNIPAGVTVTFKNHATRAPVVWLVQGSVNIAGTVSVDGKPGLIGTNAISPPEGGPGGFRGGPWGQAGRGSGLGIGGGNGSSNGMPGAHNGTYGNPQILPLIGGSGGAGNSNVGSSGGGGGGAILVASTDSVFISGTVSARNAAATNTAAGSGGAIKLIANEVSGTGSINAGSTGRTRIEANSLSAAIVSTPSTIAVPPGTTPIIFQSAIAPTVRILSVDGTNAPADPTAPLETGADLAIEKNTAVTIALETRNFPIAGSVVSVRRAVKFGGVEWKNATLVSGNNALATWQVSMTFDAGFNTLQARATAP